MCVLLLGIFVTFFETGIDLGLNSLEYVDAYEVVLRWVSTFLAEDLGL